MKVFGLKFSDVSQDGLVAMMTRPQPPEEEGARVIHTANLDHIVQLGRNAAFRAAYDDAWIVTADGTPVFLYAKLRGARNLPRLTGSDLFRTLLPRLDPNAHRCFFVASSHATARVLTRDLQARGFSAPALRIAVPPFGFESDQTYSQRLADEIRGHGATHLFFGLGAPKSEIWIHRHKSQIGNCYVLSVGAALDFVAGTKRRAPDWMQATGLEWLYRFSQEPQRLFRRYFVDSWAFLAAVRRDLAGRH